MALAPRLIIRLEHDESMIDGHGVAVVVKAGEHGNYGPEQRVGLSALSYVELKRAVMNVNGKQTPSTSNDERIAEIKRIVKAEGYRPNVFTPKPKSERETIKPPITITEAIPVANLPENESEAAKPQAETPTVTVATGNKLADALAELIPTVDVEAIKREVIGGAIAAVESRLSDVETINHVITFPTYNYDLPKLHHSVVPDVIRAVAAGCHVMLIGPAGGGKSTIAEQVFAATGRTYHPMSCDPSMMRHDIFGFRDGNGNFHATPAFEAFTDENGGLLVDELDNGHPSILAGMNQMLANGSCSFGDGETHKRGEGFGVIATANTWGAGATSEYVGRNPIDAATLDRFAVKFYIDYDLKMERGLGLAYATDETHVTISEWVDYLQGLRRRINKAEIKKIVSPRAVIAGAKLIASGLSLTETKEWTVLAGLDKEIRAQVEA